MKNEFDQIKITNNGKCSDYSEHIRSYDNDNPRFVKENSLSKQKETFRAKELSDEVVHVNKEQSLKNEDKISQNTSAMQSGVQSASSAMSSIASSIGSGIGALAGVVATTVVAAVVVVVAFVSTLTINLSLFMADTNSLVFEVEMSGAQEEDFEDPIYAVLTSDDGTHIEQQITLDDVYLTYNDLKPGREYTIKIKNSEKVFVEKSFFTDKEKTERGQLTSSAKGTLVLVAVQDVLLQQGEYYTLEVRDSKGNVVFSVDSVNTTAEYSFEVAQEMELYCSLSVNGKSYAMSQLEVKAGPEYDFANPTWTWAEDYSMASVTFIDLNGEDPLVLNAKITIEDQEPTCTVDGQRAYLATATYNGQSFNDAKFEVLEAFGHNYLFEEFEWDDEVAKAVYRCKNNPNHVQYYPAEVTWEITTEAQCEQDGIKTYTATYEGHVDTKQVIIPATGHDYGDLIEEKPATCDEDGVAAHYYCQKCQKYFDKDKNETTLAALTIEKFGHVLEHYDAGYNSSLEMQMDEYYYCSQCESYFDKNQNEAELSEIGYPYLSYSNSGSKITIYADGYMRSDGKFVPFVSSSTNPYYITGTKTGADQSLDMRGTNHDGTSPENKAILYLTFDNLTINAGNWASAVYILAYNELEINITNIGTTTIKGYNHPAFAGANSTSPVSIIVTCDGGFTNFICGRQYGSSPTLYNGSITFKMNGVVYNGDGVAQG